MTGGDRPRTILHVDLDAFYASVEVLDNPSLAGRPVLVGGTGPRGVVAAASYEARRFGVHSAMPMGRARRLCPEAVILPPRFDAYQVKSREVQAIFRSFTPLVEPLALDEAFLDVTGAARLFGRGPEIGAAIRARVRSETGLAASVGVAGTKLLAKLASEEAKPDGLRVIDPGTEITFLHGLPLRRLWGVGPATEARLARLGLATIGDLAALPVETLTAALGKAHGRALHDLAHNRDDRPVEPDRETKSIGHEETYPRDLYDLERLRDEVRRMAERVAERLRSCDLAGRTVTVKVRYPDFQTVTRSQTLPQPVAGGADIARRALELLGRVEVERGVRLLGVSVHNLTPAPAVQEELFPAEGGKGPRHPAEPVTRAVDAVKARFGPDAVQFSGGRGRVGRGGPPGAAAAPTTAREAPDRGGSEPAPPGTGDPRSTRRR